MAKKESGRYKDDTEAAGGRAAPNDARASAMQDAFVRRAQDAVERAIQQGGGISPEEMLKRMDDRLAAAQLDPRLPKN